MSERGKRIIAETLSNEGVKKSSLGYVNDPKDNGGETLAGIAYKFHPKWIGWTMIIDFKKQPNFPQNMVGNKALFEAIVEFYIEEFWNVIKGDNITDDDIAHRLVDSAVLEGIGPAVKRAEQLCGLPQTGKVSAQLIEALNDLA